MHVKSKCCCFVSVVVIVDDDRLMCPPALKEKLMHSEAVGGGCM